LAWLIARATTHAQVFTVEMHHKRVDAAGPGDNCGLSMRGLDKANMPRVGDIMVLKTDASIGRVRTKWMFKYIFSES
jgi:translation elongation factor EF-Tu-like GTPase